MMKDKYLETMRQVGFQEVKIIEETRFSKEDVTTNPSVEAAMKNPEMAKQIEETLNSTASVKVSAIKPPN